jgi:predicted amino acid-binding ACT domain protein
VKDILLINVSGQDKPGVTSAVTDVLARYDVTVLDIGQAVIHNQLNLGILAAVPRSEQTSDVTDGVLASLDKLDMVGRFLPITEDGYQNWVEQQGKPRHIVTLLARKIDACHLAAVTKVASEQGLNIDKIVRLSGRVQLDESDQLGRACIEFSARGQAHDAASRQPAASSLHLRAQHALLIEHAFKETIPTRRSKVILHEIRIIIRRKHQSSTVWKHGMITDIHDAVNICVETTVRVHNMEAKHICTLNRVGVLQNALVFHRKQRGVANGAIHVIVVVHEQRPRRI